MYNYIVNNMTNNINNLNDPRFFNPYYNNGFIEFESAIVYVMIFLCVVVIIGLCMYTIVTRGTSNVNTNADYFDDQKGIPKTQKTLVEILPLPDKNIRKLSTIPIIGTIPSPIPDINSKDIENGAINALINRVPTKYIDDFYVQYKKRKINRLKSEEQRTGENKFNIEKIPMNTNLPWDKQIDICHSLEGTIDDIDWRGYVAGYRPKLILY